MVRGTGSDLIKIMNGTGDRIKQHLLRERQFYVQALNISIFCR